MDVGGRFSGTVTGVMNMAGATAASFTGHRLDRSSVMMLGTLIWIFLIDPDTTVVEA